jgi:hypothetical protein
MMRHFTVTLAGALILAAASIGSFAQSPTSASTSQSTSASAGATGAQASSATSTNAASSVMGVNQTSSAASQVQAGSTVHAALTKPVDARKNKAGDEVVAKTTQDVKSGGHVVIPRGSKIVGHVTEAKARAKGQNDSSLGLAFDHAVLKDGSTVPVSFAVQAIGNSSAAAQAEDESLMAPAGAGMSAGSTARAGGGLVGGVGATAGGVTNSAARVGGSGLGSAGSIGGAVSGPLTPTSRGVVGMPNLNLASATSNSSMITSSTNNVHLDSGTEMILRANQ